MLSTCSALSLNTDPNPKLLIGYKMALSRRPKPPRTHPMRNQGEGRLASVQPLCQAAKQPHMAVGLQGS